MNDSLLSLESINSLMTNKDIQASGYGGVVCVEYMNTPGWHGMIPVNAVQESTKMRDSLRDARDKASKVPAK